MSTTADKLRQIATSVSTKSEIVDRELVVKDLCEAADEIDRLQKALILIDDMADEYAVGAIARDALAGHAV